MIKDMGQGMIRNLTIIALGFGLCMISAANEVDERSLLHKQMNKGCFGATFEIVEEDLLEVIQKRLQTPEAQAKLDLYEKEVIASMEKAAYQPKAATGWSPATERVTRYMDPSIAYDQDLSDQNGQVFYHKGDPINPLSYLTLTKSYLFIDGDSDKEVAFAKKLKCEKNIKIILVKGPVLKLRHETKSDISFDQNGVMIKRFGLTHIPCLVSQEGTLLKIDEWDKASIEAYVGGGDVHG
jgi:conjugal transfer pilus assembly protein TraW